LPSSDKETSDDLVLKLKFFELQTASSEEESEDYEPKRLRVRFTKKRGDLMKWYDIFSDMQETVFDDLLLAPRIHQ